MERYHQSEQKSNVFIMRRFSYEENQVISMLITHTAGTQPFLPINLFNDIFQTGTVGFDCKQSLLFFQMQYGQAPNIEYMMDVYNKLLEKTMLLEYLQSEGLVYIVHMATTTNSLYTTGTIGKPSQTVQYPVDKSISQALFQYMNEPIYVGETLKAYVETGFKSLEDLSLQEAQKQTSESRKQTFLSFLAVAISLVALMLSLMQNGQNDFQGDRYCIENDNDSRTLNIPVGVMLNNIEGKLDATMNNTAEIHAKLCDTINVRIKGENKIIVNPGIKNSQTRQKVQPKSDPCVKKVKINTCKDTIVSKSSLLKNNDN